VAATKDSGGNSIVVLLPITHAPPTGSTGAVELPARVCASLGFDDARSWITVSEYNDDIWPSAGVVPIPGRNSFAYGYLPPLLLQQVKDAFLARVARNRDRGVSR
jgi:hypothetical protein